MKKWIAAAFAFVCSVVMADMDRYGNVMLEDDGGNGGPIPAFYAQAVILWIILGVLIAWWCGKKTTWSGTLVFHVAFFGGGLASLFAMLGFR